MTTEKPTYVLVEVTCAKKDCNETYSVIISSTYNTNTNRPVEENDPDFSKQKDISIDRIDEPIIIKCSCGHSQRVSLEQNNVSDLKEF